MKLIKRTKHPQIPVICFITFLFLVLSAANVWAKPTPGGRPRWTIPTFTPTPTPDTGSVCVYVYHDRNRDGVRQPEAEDLLPGAKVYLKGIASDAVLTGTTTSQTEPYCFRAVSPDTYLVREENPPGFKSTTEDLWGAIVLANTTVSVPFGDVAAEEATTSLPLILRSFERSE